MDSNINELTGLKKDGGEFKKQFASVETNILLYG